MQKRLSSVDSSSVAVIQRLKTTSTAAEQRQQRSNKPRHQTFTATLAQAPLTTPEHRLTLQLRRHDRGLYGSRPADDCLQPVTAPLRHGQETRPVLTVRRRTNSRPGELQHLVTPAIHRYTAFSLFTKFYHYYIRLLLRTKPQTIIGLIKHEVENNTKSMKTRWHQFDASHQ